MRFGSRTPRVRVFCVRMRLVMITWCIASVLLLAGVSCSSGKNGSGRGGGAGDSSDTPAAGRGSDARGGQSGDAATGGQDSGVDAGGGDSPGQGGNGSGPDRVPGDVPAELVGIWQETRASGGDYVNPYGERFSSTSGFSVQLRIAENGSYQWSHYASGASSTCASASYFDRSVGTAVLAGDVLTLYPTKHRVDIDQCETQGTDDAGLDPVELTLSVKESTHFYGGLRTYQMHVEGASQPFDLTLLVCPPLAEPEQPPQPADFSLGQDPPFQELQGLWVAAAGTDSNFFDPETGEFYFPELNGSPHQWLRFAGENYETAVALQTINAEGVCKADLIYYEQGRALLQVLDDVGGQHSHFDGHIRMEAAAARLIIRVRECDVDDGVYQYDVPGQLSYYRWMYFSPANPPESFTLNCDFPLSEWQSTLCETRGYSRRE